MGQRHPEGEQLLLSPLVLPLLLPPHLFLCILVTALMPGLTDMEPLPHFDVRPRCQLCVETEWYAVKARQLLCHCQGFPPIPDGQMSRDDGGGRDKTEWVSGVGVWGVLQMYKQGDPTVSELLFLQRVPASCFLFVPVQNILQLCAPLL